jgi:hypothetical protein
MFGLIMALTFTSSVSVASSTLNDVATMLACALSCNVAWGLSLTFSTGLGKANTVLQRRARFGQLTSLSSLPSSRLHQTDVGPVEKFLLGSDFAWHPVRAPAFEVEAAHDQGKLGANINSLLKS